MAAELEKLAKYYWDRDNQPRENLYTTLAEEERAIGGPETVVPVRQTTPTGSPEAPKPHGLEQIRYVIEIPEVSEELYARTREALEATGYTFVAAIRSVSIKDLLLEDEQREREGKPRRLDYVNDSKTMRATVPPEIEVAINPSSVRIERSNCLSTNDQQARIREEEVRWKKQLLEDVRPYVSMRMVDPSTYSQLEDAYMDKEGELLFPNYFARTDVQTVRGYVADVGRVDPRG